MDLLESFIGCESEAGKDAAILAGSRLPLFVWGRGVMATWVYSWLTENHIAIAGFFTDDVPKPKNNEKFYGLDVLSLEAICAKHSEFNVLVGHAQGYQMSDDLKCKHKNIQNVYAIDIGVLWRAKPIHYDFKAENKSAFDLAKPLRFLARLLRGALGRFRKAA
jgi:hypothetical protein